MMIKSLNSIVLRNVFLAFLLFSFVVSNAADLNVSNNQTVTISSNNTYDNITLGQNSTLNILSGVVVNAINLNVLNNAVINLDGTLNLTGNVSVSNNAGLTVNSTGVMDVDGDVSAGNNSSLDLGGTVTIDGDLDAGGADITVDGDVDVGGTFTGSVDSGSGTLASGNGNNYNDPLPVVLLFANINTENNLVNLSWATSAEINNDYFSIKISRDLNSWELVDRVDGFGNTTTVTEYNYSFASKYGGQVYVQLSQTDFDGTTEVLKITTINIEAQNFAIYPNPMRAGQQLNIKGISNDDKVQIFTNSMMPVLDESSLDRGLYYVIINDTEVHKLIVQ